MSLETSIEDTISFESMSILIDNVRMQTIEGHLLLHLGDVGYRVQVKEASCSFQINPQFIVPAGSSPMEVKVPNEDSQNVEVHGIDVAVRDEMGSRHWPKANRLEDATLDGVVRESPNFEFEDGIAQHLQMNKKSPSGSSNSSLSTKTA